MKVQASALTSNQLAKVSVVIVSGDDPLLMRDAGDAVRKAWCQQTVERQRFDAATLSDWSAFTSAFENMSLFASNKIVELHCQKAKIGKEAAAALLHIASMLNDEQRLLVVMPKCDASTAKQAWFKALDSKGLWCPIWPIKSAQLKGWVANRFKQSGFTLQPDALSFIVHYSEGNLLAIVQVLDKVLLMCEPGELSLDTVQGFVYDQAKFSPFDLADAVLQGRVKRVRNILRHLKEESVEPAVVLWALVKDVLLLNQLVNEPKQAAAILQKQRVFEQRKTLVQQALGRLSVAKTNKLLQLSQQADQALKGVLALEVWFCLDQLALAVCDFDRVESSLLLAY